MSLLNVKFSAPVIYYHSIGPKNTNWYRNYLTTDPEVFEEQIKYFVSRFSIISLKDFWLIRKGKLKPVRNPLIINFDDGYLDNFIWAFPILKKYGVKVTIFISPEFTDNRDIVRTGDNESGFLSWEEMKVMEESGWVDIQSHTMTHTKYFISEKILDFHNPESDYLYPIGNLHPDLKPYYIGDNDFKKLIPYGFPFFEESSSVIARRVVINPDFTELCIRLLSNYDFSDYNFNEVYNIIKPYYHDFLRNGKLIIARESEEEYKRRIYFEIVESKKVIELKLNKKVEFLCWPHGDNNEELHRLALEAGYLMTTKGKARDVIKDDQTRIPERMGVDFSSWNKKQKTVFKLKAFTGKTPYCQLLNMVRYVRF